MSLSVHQIIVAAALALVGAYTVAAAVRTDLPWPRWRLGALAAARLLLVAAVAAWVLGVRVEWHAASRRVELVVVADRSASLSAEGRKAVADWTQRAGPLASSRHPAAAVIAIDADGGRATPLAEALDAARCSFAGRGEKRILLLSDGRATTADPLAIAQELKRDGIRVFAIPAAPLDGESLIADLAVPAAAWRSVPVPVEVMLRSSAAARCRLTLLVDGEKKDERDVKLRQGLNAVEMTASFERDGVHQVGVQASFANDVLDWNNAASALVDVPLAPRVAILSDVPAARHPLAAALSASGLEVRVLPPSGVPERLACDCIVLDSIEAKALGEVVPVAGNGLPRAIEEFVRDGGALVFAGGPHAYGAGGYLGTPLEPVFPVLLEPKKEFLPFALAVVLDNSWSMNEGITSKVGKIDIAKEIAIAAMEGLNQGDWLALVSFDSDYHNIIPPTRVKDLAPAEYEVARIGAFGMTNILGALEEAARILKAIDAAYKHILVISDGKQTETGTDYSHLLAALGRMRMTLSTIGVGLNPDAKLLNTLAYAGKGRYSHAGAYNEIPAVVLQEAKSLENQLAVEVPFPAKQAEDDPALAGIDVSALPPLLGYNRSRARPHAWTPLVISPKGEPLLARMRYGRGQAVAFLSSATSRWAKDWMEKRPADYVAFWRQLVASALGPPHHVMAPAVSYEDGRPVFDFGDSAVTVHRLADGRVAESSGQARASAAGADAILATQLTSRRSQNLREVKGLAAFSWSRTSGREFADPAEGLATLKELCRITDGVFQPREEELFANGRATVRSALDPAAWLVAAALLLVAELLLRRFPAVAGLFRRGIAAAAVLLIISQADAMEVAKQGSKLVLTGANFRYTWDARRGGELAEVEQRGLRAPRAGEWSGGWWLRGMPGRRPSAWQRVNSTFAWKSLDTIPALSLSTKRMAYYSGEWAIACANADRTATLKLLKEARDEVAFETESRPKILENLRLPVPWRVTQRIRVFDSGVVLIRLEVRLPEGELYELDWASMSVNLDDSLYKEPDRLPARGTPDRQARFVYGWAFPGEAAQLNSYKPVIQEMKHLPLDIDVKPTDAILTAEPLLFGSAAYDLTHVQGSAANGFAECCLEEARSLVGTKEDFGSHLMIRPQSGMSPVPTYAGSMRNQPCFGVTWNLFDGETRGLNEPLAYANTLAFAFGSRKRSSLPDALADERNVLLGARIYYARDRLPSPDEVKAIAADGCDTLLLGMRNAEFGMRNEANKAIKATVDAAHKAGLRVGIAVDVRDIKALVKDDAWFARLLQKDRDGLLVTGASFLNGALPTGEFEALGEKVEFKHDGPWRANAAPFALCMRVLRKSVGTRGFLIGVPDPLEPNLLSLAEFDLHATEKLNPYLWGSPQERCFRRYRAGAGFAPIIGTMTPQLMGLAAMHADTPIVLWPPKDWEHAAWWKLCQRLPAGGSRAESDLMAGERRFTTSSPSVHGTLFEGAGGRRVLLLATEKPGQAKVTFTPAGGKPQEMDAGEFAPWQVKILEIPNLPQVPKPAGG